MKQLTNSQSVVSNSQDKARNAIKLFRITFFLCVRPLAMAALGVSAGLVALANLDPKMCKSAYKSYIGA